MNFNIKCFNTPKLYTTYNVIYHYCSSWLSIFKLLKALSFLKKEAGDGVHFLHADKRKRCNKLALLFLMEVARHVQITENRKLLLFLQYLKKKLRQLL